MVLLAYMESGHKWWEYVLGPAIGMARWWATAFNRQNFYSLF